MIASDTGSPATSPGAGGRPITAQALELLVYLPAGALLAALEDVPETVARGRARVDQELRNAKVVGRFVVDLGLRQLKGQLAPAGGEDEGGDGGGPASSPETAEPGDPDSRGERDERGAGIAPSGTSGTSGASRATRGTRATRDPEVDHAIPDYDVLAASQVVRRLDGLGHDELRTVVRHERATRGRRTILQRAEQLLGTLPHDPTADDQPADDPGAPGAGATD